MLLLLVVGNTVVLVEVVNSLALEEMQDTAAGRWQLPQNAAAICLPCMVQRMIGEARGIMVIVASGG